MVYCQRSLLSFVNNHNYDVDTLYLICCFHTLSKSLNMYMNNGMQHTVTSERENEL